MGLNVQFAPIEDKGTGEVVDAHGPVTYQADDVNGAPTGEAEHVTGETYTADATSVESTGEHDTGDPVTVEADWPLRRSAEDKAVVDGEDKVAGTRAAKKAPARKAAAKKES